MLLLGGSGPIDRDGNNKLGAPRANTLRDLARALARHGVASLRYDKRGLGQSAAGIPTDRAAWPRLFEWRRFVDDARRALGVLAARAHVQTCRLGILGHSEGGIVALDAVSRLPVSRRPATVALLATPGRNIRVILNEQVRARLRQEGASPAEIKQTMAQLAAIWAQIRRTGRVPTAVPPALQPLFPFYLGRFWQQELRRSPTALVRRLTGPVLVVNGTRDHQVSARRDALALARALATRRPDQHTLLLLPGVGHGLDRTSAADNPTTVGPMAPAVADRIAAWLAVHLR